MNRQNKSTDKNSIKIAVCMYGFLRTFQQTSNSLINHILKTNNADLFIFAPKTRGVSIIPSNIDINYYKNTHISTLNSNDLDGDIVTEADLIKVYGNYVKKIQLYDYDFSIFTNLSKKYKLYETLPTDRICSLLFNISGSINVMLDYCSSTDKKYDAVILLRPDLAFYTDLFLANLDLNMVYLPIGGGVLNNGENNPPTYHALYYKNAISGELIRAKQHLFTDQFLISSFESMSILKNLYNNIPIYSEKKLPFHPETLLYYELAYKQNKQISYLPDFYYEILRNNTKIIENQIDLYNLAIYDPFKSEKVSTFTDFDISKIEYYSKKKINGSFIKLKIKQVVKLMLAPLKKIIKVYRRLKIYLLS